MVRRKQATYTKESIVLDVAEIETQIKENAPVPKSKAAQSPPRKVANTNANIKKVNPVKQKPQESIPIPAPSRKSKPFGSVKEPIENLPSNNITRDEIEEDVPETINTVAKETPPVQSKPITQSTKPFQMGAKAKPVFGKPANPFGNASNANIASVNDSKISAVQEDVKDHPKQEPLSFTEKYGLAKKPDPTPIQPVNQNAEKLVLLNQNVGQSNIAGNAPWMKNKPAISDPPANTTGEYIPTMGGGISTKPRRVGRPSQESNAIPTLRSGVNNESQIDKIPVMGDSNSQIGTLPRRIGQPDTNSQNGRIPIGGARNDQVNSIPIFGNQNDNSQIGRIPMMGSTRNDQVDSIPTIGNQNSGSRRIASIGRNDQFDSIPTLNSKPYNNDPIDNIPTIGDQGVSGRRRVVAANDEGQGYMPSSIPPELPGGRKRVNDPFANVAKEPVKPAAFGNNNLSRISNNSGTNNQDSMFQSNKNVLPKREEKVQPKNNDFWSDILNEDKPKPVVEQKRMEPPKPANPITSSKPTFQDVASLDDEFVLD